MGNVAVPKTGKSISTLPGLDRSAGRSPREDATEAPVGRVTVPKTGQKPSSPREDASEVPVGRVAVPKTGQKNALPRGDATEASVEGVPVPK